MSRRWRALVPLALLLLAGCDDPMVDQAKYEVYESAARFRDGKVNQNPVPGTIARGELAWRATLTERPELTPALVARGRERFDAFCSPCHSYTGDGNGMIVQRGFPRPPSFHSERLRDAPTAHFIDVITNGYGVMYSYAERVPPADRWAIAAYIRALQLSAHAEVASRPAQDAARLGPAD